MKFKHLLILFTLAFSANCMAQDPAFARANEAYANQQYLEAALIYDSLLQVSPSAELYYNLGNAYFKQGDLSQSILAYERALRLRPYYKDAQNNLRFAQSKIIDNIEDNHSFFISTWLTYTRNLLSEDLWIYISIALFALMLTGFLCFAFLRSAAGRKAGFHIAWVTLLLSICAFCFALSLHKQAKERKEAIITREMVNAKSSPDRSGTDLFLLHEGTKVSISDNLSDWVEIHVGNNVGWIPLSALERI